jgi:hypothetical protein
VELLKELSGSNARRRRAEAKEKRRRDQWAREWKKDVPKAPAKQTQAFLMNLLALKLAHESVQRVLYPTANKKFAAFVVAVFLAPFPALGNDMVY